jgi:hypothetical protein
MERRRKRLKRAKSVAVGYDQFSNRGRRGRWRVASRPPEAAVEPTVVAARLLEQDPNSEDVTSPNHMMGSATHGRNLLGFLPCGFDDVPVRIPALDAHVMRFMPRLNERDAAGGETRPQIVHALRIG